MGITFIYKISDRIADIIITDFHNNYLILLAILVFVLFVGLFMWIQIEIVLSDAIDDFHAKNNHTSDEIDLIKGGRDSTATLIGGVYPIVKMVELLLKLFVAWMGSLFSIVMGNYMTTYSEKYTSFDAVPITMAVAAFLMLASFIINPDPKRSHNKDKES